MKTPTPAPPLAQAAKAISSLPAEKVIEIMSAPLDDSGHHHWDKLRHKTPPAGLTALQWWFLIRSTRQNKARSVALRQKDDQLFSYVLTDEILEACEDIAQRASGEIKLPEHVVGIHSRDEYVVRSLVEEAITSSQLEGASTSRRVAKDMLRTGREPQNTSELMILNNFSAMEFVRTLKDEELTPELVLQIHAEVTEGTLEDPEDSGRLDHPDKERVVIYGHDDQVLHVPPPTRELSDRLESLCAFANGSTRDGYLSPVIRSIILHFMVGYDHYFADGNGRTARALFYWSMLKHGYWTTEYLTISKIIKKAPSKYSFAYLLTEDDGGDLTYFIHYHLKVIQSALDELDSYLKRKAVQIHTAREQLNLDSRSFRDRQVKIVESLTSNPDSSVSVAEYSRRFAVSPETARKDLNDLVRHGHLVRSKQGKAFVWKTAS